MCSCFAFRRCKLKRKQLCKKLHILQKLSFLTTQTKGLAFIRRMAERNGAM